MARASLVTIEDNTLRALMNDPQVKDAFPCLDPAKQQLAEITGRGCKKCEKDKRAASDKAMTQARRCLSSARGKSLEILKRVLNAKQIRILARNTTGKVIQWTLQ